jgi:hypothetical protein
MFDDHDREGAPKEEGDGPPWGIIAAAVIAGVIAFLVLQLIQNEATSLSVEEEAVCTDQLIDNFGENDPAAEARYEEECKPRAPGYASQPWLGAFIVAIVVAILGRLYIFMRRVEVGSARSEP